MPKPFDATLKDMAGINPEQFLAEFDATLRIPRDQVRPLFQGVRAMRESDTYQAILDEGEVRGLQHTLLRLGRKRFGEPGEGVLRLVEGITDLERLERLTEDLLDVATWQEFLGRARP